MSKHKSKTTIALITGLSLLIMTIAAIYSEFSILQKLFTSDLQNTFNNVIAHQNQIKSAIFGYLIVFIMDIFAAWGLCIFLQNVNKNLSLLAAWLRIIYTTIATCSLFFLIQLVQLLNLPNYQSLFTDTQLQTRVYLLLNSFYDAWGISYVFFGLHLVLLGYLIIKSKFVPKIIGFFVFIAGISYIIDYLGKFLFPGMDLNVSTMFGWGELLFMTWLLYYGLIKRKS